MKRLFVAVGLDAQTREAVDRISSAVRELMVQKGASGRVTWVRKDRMHLTVLFLGAADEALERRLLGALAEPIPLTPFALDFRGLGCFPSKGSPRVLWLRADLGADRLCRVHDEIMRRIGDRKPGREPFNPHLTLARFRDRVRRADLEEIAARPAFAGPCLIDRVTLYESHLSPKGPAYEPLAEATFTACT